MDKMIYVACAVIIHEAKILIAQRGLKMAMPGKWEFPGGKIEKDESPEDCIKREILEEIGIDILLLSRLPDFFHDYGHLKITLVPFFCQYLSGEIHLTEHQQFMWVTKSELHQFDWAEADLGVINMLTTKQF